MTAKQALKINTVDLGDSFGFEPDSPLGPSSSIPCGYEKTMASPASSSQICRRSPNTSSPIACTR